MTYDPNEARDLHGRWMSGGATEDALTPHMLATHVPARVFTPEANALSAYTDYTYAEMNHLARTGKLKEPSGGFLASERVSRTALIAEHNASLDRLIAAQKPLEVPAVVYRKADMKLPGVGRTFTDAGFVSTSTHRGFTGAGHETPGKDTIISALLPKGTRGYYVRGSSEKEFILPRGSRFKVHSKGSDGRVAVSLIP